MIDPSIAARRRVRVARGVYATYPGASCSVASVACTRTGTRTGTHAHVHAQAVHAHARTGRIMDRAGRGQAAGVSLPEDRSLPADRTGIHAFIEVD